MPVCKPYWEITEKERTSASRPRAGAPPTRLLPRRRVVDRLHDGGYALHDGAGHLVAGLGPVLQIAEGETVRLPPDVHDALDARTRPLPTTWFVPRCDGSGPFRDAYTVMSHWGANHGAVSYGHIGADLITIASMLRIPVDMRTPPEEDVFRPARGTASAACASRRRTTGHATPTGRFT